MFGKDEVMQSNHWVPLNTVVTVDQRGNVAVMPFLYAFNHATGELKVIEVPDPPQRKVVPAVVTPANTNNRR